MSRTMLTGMEGGMQSLALLFAEGRDHEKPALPFELETGGKSLKGLQLIAKAINLSDKVSIF